VGEVDGVDAEAGEGFEGVVVVKGVNERGERVVGLAVEFVGAGGVAEYSGLLADEGLGPGGAEVVGVEVSEAGGGDVGDADAGALEALGRDAGADAEVDEQDARMQSSRDIRVTARGCGAGSSVRKMFGWASCTLWGSDCNGVVCDVAVSTWRRERVRSRGKVDCESRCG
jgi:hypothetical protein